jgi:protein gp37
VAENSKIEWTDHTFNPWTGCTKVSPGCDHCYAEGWAKRSGAVKWGAGEPRRRTTAANWKLPLKWNARAEAEGRRYKVFCASLSDWADNSVPPAWRAELFAVIGLTPWLDYLMLTKRIGNVPGMLAAPGMPKEIPANVRVGATMVNQEEWDRDIDKLLSLGLPNFVSIEPLLGPIDMRGKKPDWVIVGGESGHGARPMHPDWARSLRDQCAAAGVPFLFKQWGEWTPGENVERQRGTVDTAFLMDDCWGIYPLNLATDGGHIDDQPDLYRVGKKAAGRWLDGVTHDGFPA